MVTDPPLRGDLHREMVNRRLGVTFISTGVSVQERSKRERFFNAAFYHLVDARLVRQTVYWAQFNKRRCDVQDFSSGYHK
jgi:hypothetical protein